MFFRMGLVFLPPPGWDIRPGHDQIPCHRKWWTRKRFAGHGFLSKNLQSWRRSYAYLHTFLWLYKNTFISAIVRNSLTNNSISVRRWLIIVIMDLFSGRPFRSHGSKSAPLTLCAFPACFVPLPGSPHLVLAPPALPLCIHPCMFFPPICHGVFYCFFCIFTHITSPFKSVLIPFARPVMASTITLIVSNRTPLR